MILSKHGAGKWQWLAAGVAFAMLLAPAHTLAAGPRISIAESQWDFGVVTNEDRLEHEFTVRNEGTAELVISRVASGCEQCLVSRMESTIIAPGGGSLLKCWLDLRILQGPVEREVYIYSNDDERSPMIVRIKGTAVPLYRVSPLAINLDLAVGPGADQVEIVPLVKLRAPLSEVICTNEGVVATVTAGGFGRSLLTVQATESLPHTNLFFVLTVRSADPGDPPCNVRASIHNPPELEILPDRLQFNALADPQVGLLWIRRRGLAPPALLDVISPSDKYRCEIDPAPDDSGYRVFVTALQQESLAGQTTQLTVKLRDADQKERYVPVPITVTAKDWRTP